MLRDVRAAFFVFAIGVSGGLGVLGTRAAAEPNVQVEALLRRADEISVEVAMLRGLPLKEPVKRGYLHKEAIRAHVLQRMAEEQTPAELAAEELLLKRWGLIAPATDFKTLVIELLTEQIAGFYDPLEKQLYITESGQVLGNGSDDMLMAHELGHALQDQHFDLRAFMDAVEHNDDASMARRALVEGDGMVLMLEYLFRQAGKALPWSDPAAMRFIKEQMSGQVSATTSSDQSVFDSAPLVMREGLIFPYVAGFNFVAHARARKLPGWSAVDAMYRKPPLATEHILHPVKYALYERPDIVNARALGSLAGYRMAYDNVYGELGLRVILQQHLGAQTGAQSAAEEVAERAAAGWGGDRLVLYVPSAESDHDGSLQGVVSVLYSVWDSGADAAEFFAAVSGALPSLSQGSMASQSARRIVYHDAAGSAWVAERKGGAVVLVVGVDARRAPAVLAEVWKRWQVARR